MTNSERILTDKEKCALEKHRDEWLKISLNTNPIDQKSVIQHVGDLYELIKKKRPPVLFCKSPLSANVLINRMQKDLPDKEIEALKDKNGYIDTKGMVKKLKEMEYFSTFFWGQLDSYWISFYSFPVQHMGAKLDQDLSEKLAIWTNIAKHCFWWYPFENAVIASQRPTEIHLNANHRMHCIDGPAISFDDGWGLYFMNGVVMPKDIIETPANQITKEMLLNISNAEVRGEAMLKVGIERVFEVLETKILDETEDKIYALHILQMGKDDVKRPYLAMLNPSTGKTHFEGVEPSIRTVDAALTWRNKTSIRPVQLT